MIGTIVIRIPTATDYWGQDVTPEEVQTLIPRFRELVAGSLAKQYPEYETEFQVVEHNTGTGVSVDPEDHEIQRDIEEFMSAHFIDVFDGDEYEP